MVIFGKQNLPYLPFVTKFTYTFTCIQSPLPPRLAKFHPIVVSIKKSKISSTKLSPGDSGASLEQLSIVLLFLKSMN